MHAAPTTSSPLRGAARATSEATTTGQISRLAWTGLGVISLGLAVVGAVLPVMPATVFLLGAAASFSKGSPRLESWLVNHHRLGPVVRSWRAERAIPQRARFAALASMAVSWAVVALTAPTPVAASLGLVLAAVALYVGTRPDPRIASDTTLRAPSASNLL